MALPGAALVSLRRSLRAEVGALPAIHALQAAGSDVGREILPALLTPTEVEAAAEIASDRFWNLLENYFQRRGWGRILHRSLHPSVGLLVATEWAEAEETDGELQPTCAFTTGLLSGLLTGIADAPVAVLEVECRSRGDGECHFAFGSGATIHRIYGDLLEGSDFEEALSRI